MKFVITVISILIFINCFGQISNDEVIVSKFNRIEENPSLVSFKNNKKINNRGGHLQGVQLIQNNTFKYAVLSGSSDSYSYYSVVKLGAENEVISVNKLMEKPFKHAGGFQIFENYFAVGIEDNSKKDKSKVCIYDISDPENPSLKPLAIIEREGKPLRSTAGCVGITKYKNHTLVAVGDWNTKHIDFYSCNLEEIEKDSFEKIASIDTEKLLKENWINKNWHSYQNINLFTFNNNDLYLVGLGINKKGENIADLFSLKEDDIGDFSFIKLASKTFSCENESSFKAGAGAVLSAAGDFKIISCSYNIENISYLNLFKSLKNNGETKKN
jgi:hypothetical protein